jgi:hypothetical protein
LVHDPQTVVRAAQEEHPYHRERQPLAMVVGVKNKDAEDWQLEASPDFWRMIQQR